MGGEGVVEKVETGGDGAGGKVLTVVGGAAGTWFWAVEEFDVIS